MPITSPLFALRVLFIGLLAVPIVSFLCALFVRLAASLCRVEGISYRKAYYATVVTNGVLVGLLLTYYINAVRFAVSNFGLRDELDFVRALQELLMPTPFFMTLIGCVLIHAIVFRYLLVEKDSLEPSRAQFIAIIYMAMFTFTASLAGLSYSMVLVWRNGQ